ncbi:MFS transporter [Bdellovibrio bacteriovorus W]|nr:MFS transporter [Bdellovibrio bacteriovorus W]
MSDKVASETLASQRQVLDNPVSVWAPLKSKLFLYFWVCAFLSNLGTWIQDVAAGWVMTHLNSSPLIISLLSFSGSLPILFFSIPGGYLADKGYKRQLLLFAQILMFCSAGTLAYLVWQEQITVPSLLSLALLMGLGFALTNPAFQSVLTDIVPGNMQAQAVLVYYMGINITRVVGPSIGGGLLSGFGPEAAFFVNSLSFLGLIVFFYRWPLPASLQTQAIPKFDDSDWAPLFSLPNLRRWLEIFLVTFFASAMWALYPSRGRVELELSSLEFGSLLGFFGIGACVSAFLSNKIMLPGRSDQSLAGSYLVYGIGMLILGFAPNYLFICVAMFLAGTGWLVLATLMNMNSRQMAGASRLKATMLGVFLSVFYAGMALGAVSWGALAKVSSTTVALVAAGTCLGLFGFYKGIVKTLDHH